MSQRTYSYLKFPSEADWSALFDAHLAEHVVEVDVLGTIFHETGATTTTNDGLTVPVMAAVPGFHVNVILHDGAFPAALYPYCVNPVAPKRVFFGVTAIEAPETLPDDGDTVMVTRAIGAVVPEPVLRDLEAARIRAKLSGEERADRIALYEANLAVMAERAVRATLVDERLVVIATLTAKQAERATLVAERGAQIVIRNDAIGQLTGLVGAARLPVVAVRDAATAEITRLNALIAAVDAVLPGLIAARDAANAALDQATAELAALRATRDALRAALA